MKMAFLLYWQMMKRQFDYLVTSLQIKLWSASRLK